MKKFNLKQNLVSFLFIAFLGVLFLLFIFWPKEEFSQKEKRYLAEFPKFSFDALVDGGYTEGIEEYLADHTPMRDFFVGVNSYYSYVFGNNGSNGVYLSSDGYLVEVPVSSENKFQSNVSKIATFSEKTDVPVVFALAPSKGYLYSEKLPKNHLKYSDGEYFLTASELADGRFVFVDLLSALTEHKTDGELYYKTDHHWTSLGAYFAYQKICNALNIEPSSADSYSKEYVKGFYGTSYASSGYWFSESDTIEVWKRDGLNDINVEIYDSSEGESYNSMFFDDKFATEDKYNGFLGGNHSIVRVKNSACSNGKLIVVKDSFAHCLVPFLAEHYSEIVMVDLRYYKMPLSQLIEKEGADCVLFMYSLDNIAESTDIILR